MGYTELHFSVVCFNLLAAVGLFDLLSGGFSANFFNSQSFVPLTATPSDSLPAFSTVLIQSFTWGRFLCCGVDNKSEIRRYEVRRSRRLDRKKRVDNQTIFSMCRHIFIFAIFPVKDSKVTNGKCCSYVLARQTNKQEASRMRILKVGARSGPVEMWANVLVSGPAVSPNKAQW